MLAEAAFWGLVAASAPLVAAGAASSFNLKIVIPGVGCIGINLGSKILAAVAI